jgi:hypothetical protein
MGKWAAQCFLAHASVQCGMTSMLDVDSVKSSLAIPIAIDHKTGADIRGRKIQNHALVVLPEQVETECTD